MNAAKAASAMRKLLLAWSNRNSEDIHEWEQRMLKQTHAFFQGDLDEIKDSFKDLIDVMNAASELHTAILQSDGSDKDTLLIAASTLVVGDALERAGA